MKIGIIGTRRRNTRADFQAVHDEFLKHFNRKRYDWIVSGGCPKGGDSFAEKIAKDYGITILIHYPRWYPDGKYNSKAGFERNTLIAYHSDILIACVHLDRTGGTEDTINKYLKLCEKIPKKQERLILV